MTVGRQDALSRGGACVPWYSVGESSLHWGSQSRLGRDLETQGTFSPTCTSFSHPTSPFNASRCQTAAATRTSAPSSGPRLAGRPRPPSGLIPTGTSGQEEGVSQLPREPTQSSPTVLELCPGNKGGIPSASVDRGLGGPASHCGLSSDQRGEVCCLVTP